MRTRQITMIACAATLLAALPGCETLTPRLDSTFGDAVNVAKARQILDKDAAVRNASKDVAGLDGVAAREAMDRYYKSFKTPEPTPNVFQMGVSGTQSGSTQ